MLELLKSNGYENIRNVGKAKLYKKEYKLNGLTEVVEISNHVKPRVSITIKNDIKTVYCHEVTLTEEETTNLVLGYEVKAKYFV